MGNILGMPGGERNPAPAAAHMNIPPEGVLNDPNFPYSKQIWGIVINGLIPMAGVCLFAYTAKKHRDEKKRLLSERDYTVAKLTNELEQRKRFQGEYRGGNVGEILLELEREENVLRLKKLKDLKVYDETLEKILDVRCSLFKTRDQRIHLESILINNITKPVNSLQGLDMYRGLDDIFKYDYLFCGHRKEDNGKLRKIYMEHWKLKVELQRYKNIVERLRVNLGINSGQ